MEGLTWDKSEEDKLTRQSEDGVEGYQGHAAKIKHHPLLYLNKKIFVLAYSGKIIHEGA